MTIRKIASFVMHTRLERLGREKCRETYWVQPKREFAADSLQIAQKAKCDIISGCSLTKILDFARCRGRLAARTLSWQSRHPCKPEFSDANRSARSPGSDRCRHCPHLRVLHARAGDEGCALWRGPHRAAFWSAEDQSASSRQHSWPCGRHADP